MFTGSALHNSYLKLPFCRAFLRTICRIVQGEGSGTLVKDKNDKGENKTPCNGYICLLTAYHISDYTKVMLSGKGA